MLRIAGQTVGPIGLKKNLGTLMGGRGYYTKFEIIFKFVFLQIFFLIFSTAALGLSGSILKEGLAHARIFRIARIARILITIYTF